MPGVTTQTSKDEDLGELITRLSHLIRRRGRQLPLAPHQNRALRIIARESLRPGKLAEILQVTPRAATEVIDALQAEDLVHVEPDPADRRAKLVSLSHAGHEYIAATRAARAEIAQEIFAPLSDAERSTLTRLLREVFAAQETPRQQ
ncbi:MarR family transcriptional regulator [Corynebacterium striatum]|uniref:MarR family transcriptional regulator n=1 Tax=Corynebacterium striatum TaxID=43770 RepID=A0ABC8CK91_CORST|nr:MarR family transcriptional regulator [Corynebacterium striatum]ATZ08782.1 MarR family transcriptional regulator [Corynebacterium striatum]EGT5611418.1 MarR family transcriptional regulator [Corynebacterium striatum]